MARMPRPWFRRARGEWYTTMDDKQIPLGVTDPQDEGAAWAALRRLMKEAVTEATAELSAGTLRVGTVSDLTPQFLAGCAVAPGTLKSYRQHLKWLANTFGREPAAAVPLARILQAAALVNSWGDTHRANVLATVGAFLRWCGRSEKVPLPVKESRGADSRIPDAVYARCLRESVGDFRQLLRFLWEAGCRPGEATALTAEVVGWEAGTIPVRLHKTRKKGKTRTIPLCTEALAVLKEQREKYPGGGLLFRGMRGRKLSLQAMTMRFERLSEKVDYRVTSYMFRHTWATRALEAGVPDAQVAAVLGHSSTAMIHKHYSHICENSRLLRDVAEKVSRQKSA